MLKIEKIKRWTSFLRSTVLVIFASPVRNVPHYPRWPFNHWVCCKDTFGNLKKGIKDVFKSKVLNRFSLSFCHAIDKMICIALIFNFFKQLTKSISKCKASWSVLCKRGTSSKLHQNCQANFDCQQEKGHMKTCSYF